MIGQATVGRAALRRYPHPGCFGKRGCKLLKTKDRSPKKRAKRLQQYEQSRVRCGAVGAVGEVCSR
jgi:hypothetical protein